jgi:hypothetical protein
MGYGKIKNLYAHLHKSYQENTDYFEVKRSHKLVQAYLGDIICGNAAKYILITEQAFKRLLNTSICPGIPQLKAFYERVEQLRDYYKAYTLALDTSLCQPIQSAQEQLVVRSLIMQNGTEYHIPQRSTDGFVDIMYMM